MRTGDPFDNPPHAVPCRVLVRGGQPPREVAAEAVRLDRKGAVIRLANASQSLALEADTEILVSFELPRNPALPCRLLCFSATVRHVSMADGRSGFMGVSFGEAAICRETDC